MPSKSNLIYWDSSVFIAYFNAEAGRVDIVEQLLDEVSRDQNKKIVTSIETKIEVAFVADEKATRLVRKNTEEMLDKFWANDAIIEFIELYDGIATKARSLIRKSSEESIKLLKPKDAVHLASAISLNVKEFHTYDLIHLKKFESMTGLIICEPYVIAPRLFPP